MKQKKILIAVPVLSLTYPENTTAIMRAMDQLKKEGYVVDVLYHMHESLISRGRCIIAHKFLQTDYDYLMCIDSDIVFNNDAISQLIAHDVLVVGANYRHKTEIAERWAGIAENRFSNLCKAKYLPTGFMLLKREAFTQLIEFKEKNPTFNMDYFNSSEFKHVWGFYIPYIDKDQVYLSEDWAFTKRLIDAGVVPYMDNLISLGHIGKKVY